MSNVAWRRSFAAGLMLLASCAAVSAQETVTHQKTIVVGNGHGAPAPGREIIAEGVTHMAVEAAFQPSEERQQKLLSLLLLLSAVPDNGRTK